MANEQTTNGATCYRIYIDGSWWYFDTYGEALTAAESNNITADKIQRLGNVNAAMRLLADIAYSETMGTFLAANSIHANNLFFNSMREARALLVDHYAKGQPVISVRCACCGSETKGRQWHNRDAGYGVCLQCITVLSETEKPETLRDWYGIAGVHYRVIA